jgi:hypothetical protein
MATLKVATSVRDLVDLSLDLTPIFLKLLRTFVPKVATAMPDQFPVFEVFLNKRRRAWRWRVCTTAGDVVMRGSESSRPAAKYKADRALFLLLMSAPYRSLTTLKLILLVVFGITTARQDLAELLF